MNSPHGWTHTTLVYFFLSSIPWWKSTSLHPASAKCPYSWESKSSRFCLPNCQLALNDVLLCTQLQCNRACTYEVKKCPRGKAKVMRDLRGKLGCQNISRGALFWSDKNISRFLSWVAPFIDCDTIRNCCGQARHNRDKAVSLALTGPCWAWAI